MRDGQPGLMTARQAAEYLGISLATLRKLEYGGHVLPYRTPGGHRRYSQPMLDKYLEASLGFSYRLGRRPEAATSARARDNKGK